MLHVRKLLPATAERVLTLRCSLRAIAIAAMFAALFPTVTIGSQWMGNAEIEAAFRGKTIEGAYYDGQRFKESYAADGSLSYSEGSDRRTGEWSVINGTFCTIYDINPTGGCFRVIRKSDNCFEFYFVARTEEQAQRLNEDNERASWTARGWHDSRPSTCDEVPAA